MSKKTSSLLEYFFQRAKVYSCLKFKYTPFAVKTLLRECEKIFIAIIAEIFLL